MSPIPDLSSCYIPYRLVSPMRLNQALPKGFIGIQSGLELHVDHIKPRSLGGQGTVENGQTLCSRHNFIKKNFSQTETGKKGFIRLLELVQTQKDDPESKKLEMFLVEVLEIYEKHGVNGHIRWKN